MRSLRNAFLAAALAALTLPLGSQEPASDPFGEAIDVRVVNVEAVVTDKRGNRVRGLTAADFRLLVDGKEVPVDYFNEVVDGEIVSASGEGVRPGPDASPASPFASGDKVGTSYLVFVDESFSLGAHRDLVLQKLERDLGLLAPEDRMAVVAFDGRKLDRLADWTGDRGALARVLQEARRRPAWGIHRLAMRRSNVNGNAYLYPEVKNAVAATSAAMRGVSLPTGRKVLLLFSGGWPMGSGRELLYDSSLRVPSPFHLPHPEELFEPIKDTANLLGYTIYPVDVQGIDPQSSGADASRPGATAPVPRQSDRDPNAGLDAVSVLGPSLQLTMKGYVTSDWERGVHDTLNYLAGETGGRVALNSNRLEALLRAHEDTRSYYWLGFTPQLRSDGERHEIRVEVRRPGLKVRTRDSFLDMKRSTETALRTESLLLFGGKSEAAQLQVTAGEPRRAGLGSVEVPLTIDVPAIVFTAVQAGEGFELRAIFSTASLDKYGSRSEVRMIPLRLSLPQAPRPGTLVRYETSIKLRRVEQRLILTMSDLVSDGQVWGELDLKL
jgi:VWFA-related protein